MSKMTKTSYPTSEAAALGGSGGSFSVIRVGPMWNSDS